MEDCLAVQLWVRGGEDMFAGPRAKEQGDFKGTVNFGDGTPSGELGWLKAHGCRSWSRSQANVGTTEEGVKTVVTGSRLKDRGYPAITRVAWLYLALQLEPLPAPYHRTRLQLNPKKLAIYMQVRRGPSSRGALVDDDEGVVVEILGSWKRERSSDAERGRHEGDKEKCSRLERLAVVRAIQRFEFQSRPRPQAPWAPPRSSPTQPP
ncbi:hypothetical protein B0H19DRAFT_1229868 [Mycena capillaripes]|nr:hypothetical protein B0H19DRAFT_1229868 [Mycena capillaripes]